jgi:uncharacterized protein with WD repeat
MRGCDWLKIPKFSQGNPLKLRWENLGNFSLLQLRTYLVKSQYNRFRDVNWKIIAIEQSLVVVYRERRR